MNQTLFQQAVTLHQSQQWQQALFAYTQLTQEFPAEPEPFHMIGVLYLQMSQPSKATHFIEAAIALNPNKANYHNNLGAAYRAQQDWKKAEEAWNRALALEPQSSDNYFNLGTLKIAQNNREAAHQLWLKSLKYNSNHNPTLRALAMMCHEDELYEQAFKYAKQALSTDPDSKELQELTGKCAFDYGLILRGRKQWAAAIARFKVATQWLPTSLAAWSLRSEAELKIGDLRAAFESCKMAIKLGPEKPELHHNMGNILRLSGQNSQAIEAYERAIDLGSQNSATQQAIAALNGENIKNNTEVVQVLFDQYAEHFETHLVEQLEYRVPEKMFNMLPQGFTAQSALDLGCGTGLIAEKFEGVSDFWVGVDLSREMLHKTQEKKRYHELVHGEMGQFLSEDNRTFDLIVCADTLIYLMELEKTFEAVQSHLSEGGIFLFSTEITNEQDAVFQKSERYAFNPNYVKRCANECGLSVLETQDTNLRRDGSDWIKGTLWMCQRVKTDADNR